MKHYLADTDLPVPSQYTVDNVFAAVKQYKCPECPHTFATPHPALPVIVQDDKADKLAAAVGLLALSSESEHRARSILVCAGSKENYVDCPELVLGYPISMKYDRRKRMWTTLIPELMGYEQYILQIQEKGIDKLENFEGVNLRTPGGEHYTHWLPVYINETHFTQNKQCLENTISVLSNGIEGSSSNDFQPQMVIRVFAVFDEQDGRSHDERGSPRIRKRDIRLLPLPSSFHSIFRR